MSSVLVDSNVILDLVLDDPVWADWSAEVLFECSQRTRLYINHIIYSEVSVGFQSIEDLEAVFLTTGLELLEIPREALFLAGKVFLKYRTNKGATRFPLPDFYIGAQAAVLHMDLITRDASRYRTYFPTVNIIQPQ